MNTTEIEDAASKMPADLCVTHKRNHGRLERIHIGRKIKNDTKRLEKLFQLCTKRIANASANKKAAGRRMA